MLVSGVVMKDAENTMLPLSSSSGCAIFGYDRTTFFRMNLRSGLTFLLLPVAPAIRVYAPRLSLPRGLLVGVCGRQRRELIALGNCRAGIVLRHQRHAGRMLFGQLLQRLPLRALHEPLGLRRGLELLDEQIGRASCRGRV